MASGKATLPLAFLKADIETAQGSIAAVRGH